MGSTAKEAAAAPMSGPPGRPGPRSGMQDLTVGPMAVAGCLYLFSTLPVSTIVNFLIWNAAGVVGYLLYGRVVGRLATA